MTDDKQQGTSGGHEGTSGVVARRTRYAGIGLFLAALLIQTLVNIYSTLADRSGAGLVTEPQEVWVWEMSSMIGWLAVTPLVWAGVKRLRPPHFNWPPAFGLHLLNSVVVSALHIGVMIALREAAYTLASENYTFSDHIGSALLYEYRKDAATYIQFAIVFAMIQWLVRRTGPVEPSRQKGMLLVPAGAVTHQIPLEEIDRVQSAGNYVELSWRGRNLMHRATLLSLEQQLGEHEFIRIHRSRLVRRGAVRRVETRQSGDFEVLMVDGTKLQGSRRFRQNLLDS